MKQWGQLFLQYVWVDRLDKRLPGLVTLLVLVLLTHSLAALTWRFVPAPVISEGILTNVGRPTLQQRAVNNVEKAVAQNIAGWNLFGKVEVKKPEPLPVAKVESAPDTSLNLKLRGVFAASNPRHARAIIADARNEEDSYAVGDTLPGGAVLHQVFADKVILEHNGQLETLRLPLEDAPGANGQSAAGDVNRRNTRRAMTGGIAPSAIANGDTSAMLRQYRDALLNDPQSVMGLVRATPYQKGGQLLGYRIRPGNDRQLLRRFGLRSGDVVTAVNGIPMNNPIKALEVLRDLSTARQLTVNIERRGVPQTFTFSIDQ